MESKRAIERERVNKDKKKEGKIQKFNHIRKSRVVPWYTRCSCEFCVWLDWFKIVDGAKFFFSWYTMFWKWIWCAYCVRKIQSRRFLDKKAIRRMYDWQLQKIADSEQQNKATTKKKKKKNQSVTYHCRCLFAFEWVFFLCSNCESTFSAVWCMRVAVCVFFCRCCCCRCCCCGVFVRLIATELLFFVCAGHFVWAHHTLDKHKSEHNRKETLPNNIIDSSGKQFLKKKSNLSRAQKKGICFHYVPYDIIFTHLVYPWTQSFFEDMN